MWAIKGATGMGATLATYLADDGGPPQTFLAKLAARVRLLSTGHGRKDDDADAVSVRIAALTASRQNTAIVDCRSNYAAGSRRSP